MLEIVKVKDLPTELENTVDKADIKAIYQSEGMFNMNKKDFLIVIKEEYFPEEFRCFGYVYNGGAPECSEFGYFGLNKDRTKRIW